MLNRSPLKRTLSFALCALLALAALPPAARAAVETDVSYIDVNGQMKPAPSATVIDDAFFIDLSGPPYTLNGGWYLVKTQHDGSVSNSVEGGIDISGNVNLILEDECHLFVYNGINVTGDNSLTIYAQSTDSDMGVLTANSTSKDYTAGIGGGNGQSGGKITIAGGRVSALGGNSAAGIGGGNSGDGGSITISGGEVHAEGGANGAGIGGGKSGGAGDPGGDGGNILIYGKDSHVTAMAGIGSADAIGRASTGDPGNIFIAAGTLDIDGDPVPFDVAFTATPETASGVVVANLPAPFGAVPLLSGLDENGTALEMFTTLDFVTFSLAGYQNSPITKDSGDMQSGASVDFAGLVPESGDGIPGSGGLKFEPESPPPIVGVLYDMQKSGDIFTFKVIIANAGTNMAGATVTVQLNEEYSTTVTIGEDGIGHGTLEARGFTGNIANFHARANVKGGSGVMTTYLVYSDGRVVRA